MMTITIIEHMNAMTLTGKHFAFVTGNIFRFIASPAGNEAGLVPFEGDFLRVDESGDDGRR